MNRYYSDPGHFKSWHSDPLVVSITTLRHGQRFVSIDGQCYTYLRRGSNNQFAVVQREDGHHDVFALCATVKPITESNS